MNKDINSQLEKLEQDILKIDAITKSINNKLDALIKALHDYDEGKDMFEFEIKDYTEAGLEYRFNNGKITGIEPCSAHDSASWEEEERLNKRMDVIGQNGNEGTHYDSSIDDHKPEYLKLLQSGMFFEWHPTWTGEWDKDKYAFANEIKYKIKK